VSFIFALFLTLNGPAGATSSEQGVSESRSDFPAGSAWARQDLEAGQACLRHGDEKAAIVLWTGHLRREQDSGLLDALGRLYFRQTRLSRADACYEVLVHHFPQSALAWYRLGLVRAARGLYRGAADAQRIAVGHAPGFGPAYCALALDLRESKQAAMSAWAVREALRLMPRYAGAWNLLGALQQDGGRLQDARRSFEEALRLEPAYSGAWYNLAQLWDQWGRHDLAWKAYSNAITAKPDFAEAHLARAALALGQGSRSDARRDFEACAHLDDWAPEAWWGLHRIDRAEGRLNAAAADLRNYYSSTRRRDRVQDHLAEGGMEEPSAYEADPTSPMNAALRSLIPQP